MKVYDAAGIRNVAIVGHGGCGKTQLVSSALFAAGAVFAPIAALSLAFGWGLVGVWWGLNALMAARLATLGARFRSGRWAVVGAG